jgi:hypothetical protein
MMTAAWTRFSPHLVKIVVVFLFGWKKSEAYVSRQTRRPKVVAFTV